MLAHTEPAAPHGDLTHQAYHAELIVALVVLALVLALVLAAYVIHHRKQKESTP